MNLLRSTPMHGLRAVARELPRTVLALVTAALGILSGGYAHAAALDQAGLDQLHVHVDCVERCELGRLATKSSCIQACGTAPTSWNKNLDSAVNRRDYQLALVEFWDAGTLTKICYESGAVVPKGRCGGSDCLATHTAAQCADADADGIKAWQEALVGTSDAAAQRLCASGSECNGFSEQCSYDPVLDLSYCKARASLSAFHLEKVEENASSVVVNVVFDYAPVPPTILDIYVQFNGQALVLTDSRGLLAATSAGKTVEVRQPGDNLIRVTALGISDSRVIQPGPIAELVFRRKTGDATSIQFSTVQSHREDSLAPSQGGHQIGLRQDSAWGAPVPLSSSADSAQGHVLVHYDFESDKRPISESSVLAPVDICPLLRLSSGRSVLAGDCPSEPAVPAGGPSDPAYAAAKRKRDRWISELSVLQKGVNVTTQSVLGVTGFASYFDGRNDHLELPLTFTQPVAFGGDFTEARQNFSISLWAYQEASEVANQEQVLYTRAAQASEISQFALLTRANITNDTFDLLWLSGNLSDPGAVRTVLRTGLPNRKWTHLGLSMNAATRTANVYVDGVATPPVTLAVGALVTCPQIQTGFTKRMTIHEEGDFASIQGTGPETLFLASAGGNGLYGIESMDPNGLGRHDVLRLTDSSAKDPDYSPIVDRIVYSSNQSGNSEIWVAWSDGTHAQQITDGFGSTADGIFARHPRWAPDASGIVFESNARDIDARDNLEGLGYQLYFIEYDPQANAVAIPVLGSPTTKLTQLDYAERVASGDINMYRLTQVGLAASNMQPQWLAGRTGTGDLAKGELAFTSTDANGSNPKPQRLRVAKTYWQGNDANKEFLPLVADPLLVKNRSVLAARAVRAAGQPVLERALLAEQLSESIAAPEYQVTFNPSGTCAGGGAAFTASVKYVNPTQPEKCWDVNRNQICDPSEDKNRDNACNTLDCNATEFESIYVNYNAAQAVPDMSSVQIGAWVSANEKRLRAVQAFGATTDAVRLEMTSPVNSTPIPNGTELVQIKFCGSARPTTNVQKLVIKQRFFVLTSITDEVTPANNRLQVDPFTLADPRIQSIAGAEFSPDASRLALSAIFDARPTLMRTKDVSGTANADMLTTEAIKVEGMSWAGTTQFYPCNWVGSVRHPTSKLYLAAFAGALDEIHLVDYVRTQAAFVSESERGHERLVKEGREEAGALGGTPCTQDATCGDGELCVSGACQIVTCQPSNTYPCARGRCQRLAVEVSPTEQYACVSECQSDATCQEQQCANGPCRFCDTTARTCSECRKVVENVGGLSLEYIQGCPDRNSFACDRGTCVSECYSFRNGETKYLCDPATEYCRAGRCTLFDWNWTDFSPVSFAGAGEMTSHKIKPTTAISQLYPVEIKAFGSGDYAHPPELIVEAQAPGVFGGNWFDIGRVVVSNETKSEAEEKPYVLNSPYPITTLRLRNIVPVYENLDNAAMGLINGRSGEFCTGANCRFAAQGSRFWLGYEASIPGHVAKCQRDPGSCQPGHVRYMRPGTPTLLILQVKVKNQEQMIGTWNNKICPYWNGSAAVAEPSDTSTPPIPYPMIYGDAARENSNQKRKYYPSAPASSLLTFNASSSGFGLINCNYVDDTGSAAALAGIQITVEGVSYTQLTEGDTITETANSCKVNVGTPQTPRYEACFEWSGADVSFDPFASEPIPYRTLSLTRFKSFGWGNPGDATP
ncbi:MAG TPA: hypothetical protein VFQ61_13970 [Polyangiaceae bacterium]|nr:hypothetical protein [Polyangiaceae bacterium]